MKPALPVFERPCAMARTNHASPRSLASETIPVLDVAFLRDRPRPASTRKGFPSASLR